MSNIEQETRDSIGPRWDMSQERQFMENLLGQRFNFFLVFFSLVIAGSVNAKVQLHLQLILCVGSVVCCLLWRAIARCQKKVNIILDQKLFADTTHPASIINTDAGPGSARNVVGYIIPGFCSLTLVVGAISSISGCLVVPAQAPLHADQRQSDRVSGGLLMPSLGRSLARSNAPPPLSGWYAAARDSQDKNLYHIDLKTTLDPETVDTITIWTDTGGLIYQKEGCDPSDPKTWPACADSVEILEVEKKVLFEGASAGQSPAVVFESSETVQDEGEYFRFSSSFLDPFAKAKAAMKDGMFDVVISPSGASNEGYDFDAVWIVVSFKEPPPTTQQRGG